MRHGIFDTDSKALQRRRELQEKLGSSDLNAWIFEQLEAKAGMRCLDLGCGTGKQTLCLAEIMGAGGHVTALDVSTESLEKLEQHAKAQGLNQQITTHSGNLDDLSLLTAEEPFDRVLSSYAIYYANSPESILASIFELLDVGGVGFWCGPGPGNNAELTSFLHALDPAIETAPTKAARFMDATIDHARAIFGELRVVSFENEIRYESAEDLFDFWSSHNSYQSSTEEAFCAAANRHFSDQGTFINVKRAVGIRVRKNLVR